MSEETEMKTIRVSTVEYYKLVELSGMLTTIYGVKVAISTLANVAIQKLHGDTYELFKDTMGDEKKVLECREDYRLMRLKNARLKLNAKQLMADLKKMK